LNIKNIGSFDLKNDTKLEIGLWIQARVLSNFSNIPRPGGTTFDDTQKYDFFRQRFREALNINFINTGTNTNAGVYMEFEQRGGWGGSSPYVSDPRGLGPTINPYNFLQSRGLRHGFIYYKPNEHVNASIGLLPLIDQVGRTLFDAEWDLSVGGVALGGEFGKGNYRVSYVRLIDGVGSSGKNIIGLNGHLGILDYNYRFNNSFEAGLHAYGLKIPEEYKISVSDPDTTQYQLWYGITSLFNLSNATLKAMALINSGKTNNKRHTGLALSLEGDIKLGKSSLGIYGIYTTGDKINQFGEMNIKNRFVTLHQIIGTNGFWGFTHIFLPNGPSDINDLGLEIGNRGAGLASVQTKFDFPILEEKLDGQLFAGWFYASQSRNNSQNMGIEAGGLVAYSIIKYLKVEFGASYSRMGKFYGDNPDDLFELFSRIQFTW
jgi:hypothetical protein